MANGDIEEEEEDLWSGNHVLDILEDISKLNDSSFGSSPELECILRADFGSAHREIGCDVSWDTLLCWPFTNAGTFATQQCLEELHGIHYDTSRELKLVYFSFVL